MFHTLRLRISKENSFILSLPVKIMHGNFFIFNLRTVSLRRLILKLVYKVFISFSTQFLINNVLV